MSQERFDNVYRSGDTIVFQVKTKPYIDLSVPPSSNAYRKVSCVKINIYDSEVKENLIHSGTMIDVPNRDGWYFYRFQTTCQMKPGVYTAIITARVRIDGVDYDSRSIRHFTLIDDGIM